MARLWFFVLLANAVWGQSPPRTYSALLSQVPAVYTEAASAAGLQGTVTLFITVGLTGIPKDVQVLHGLGLGLDESAVQAVSKWRYRPATLNGQPVEIGLSVDFVFGRSPADPWFVRLADYVVREGKRMESVKPVPVKFAAPATLPCVVGTTEAVKFRVSAAGVPERVEPLDPRDPLGASVVKAVQLWRFRPALVDGVPKESEGQIEFGCGAPAALNLEPGKTFDSAPVLVAKREPTYSFAARQAKIQGRVRVILAVTKSGHTSNIIVTEPLGLGLDQKAVEAVKTWRFHPAMRGGMPVDTTATVEIEFKVL